MADKTISNLNALAAPASDDEIAIVDTNVSETKKMTIANLNSGLDHDSLSGFVSNEHIDWTNASNNLDTSGTISTVDQTFSTTSSHYRLRSIVQKTAGATDADDDLTSIYGIVRLNDADSTMVDL